MAEILDLHLLELARPERVVARIDLIAEALADLRDAEGHLETSRVDDVSEIGEDALGGLRAEIDLAAFVGHGAGVRLEHQVERARFRKRSLLPASRTGESCVLRFVHPFAEFVPGFRWVASKLPACFVKFLCVVRLNVVNFSQAAKPELLGAIDREFVLRRM